MCLCDFTGETPHTAMAEQISEFASADARTFVTVHSVVGQNGQNIDYISSPTSWTSAYTQPYPASLFEARAFKAIAARNGKTFAYAAVLLTHGEDDSGNENYYNA